MTELELLADIRLLLLALGSVIIAWCFYTAIARGRWW